MRRAPVQTGYSTVVCHQLFRFIPVAEMRLILEYQDFSISRASSKTKTVVMRGELNTIDTCLCLVLVNASPHRLADFLPDLDESIVATGGEDILEFRV